MAPAVKGELSEAEKKLIEAVTKGDVEVVRSQLQESGVRVDCLDDTGMTPLQHAAFRGNYELCEMFLAHGADVNSNYHDNSYTALMFAALSGTPRVTKLMLDSGAKVDHINSVGRNAAQMAAFVGQHACVSVINNFFAKSDLEYYTKPQGLEKEPKLPPALCPVLLKMINMSNMHPVKLSLHLQDNLGLVENAYKVAKVLDIICEKSMKARDTNDVLAMKTHYFATVIRHAEKSYKEKQNLDHWIKSLLNGREGDGYPEMQDRLIRQALKDFPYPESQLLQTMVATLAKVKIGEHPSAFTMMMQGINGQKFTFDEYESCMTCGEAKAEKKCSKCKTAYYCDGRCQKLHWFTHKKFCDSMAAQYKELRQKVQEEQAKIDREKKTQEEIQQQLNNTQITPEQNSSTTEDPTHPQINGTGLPSTGDTISANMPPGDTTSASQQTKES